MVAGSEDTQPWNAMEACGEENNVNHPTCIRSYGQAQALSAQFSEGA